MSVRVEREDKIPNWSSNNSGRSQNVDFKAVTCQSSPGAWFHAGHGSHRVQRGRDFPHCHPSVRVAPEEGFTWRCFRQPCCWLNPISTSPGCAGTARAKESRRLRQGCLRGSDSLSWQSREDPSAWKNLCHLRLIFYSL